MKITSTSPYAYDGSVRSLTRRQDSSKVINEQVHLTYTLMSQHGPQTETASKMQSVIGILGKENSGLGSGFVVDPQGHILTAYHVIEKHVGDKLYGAFRGFPKSTEMQEYRVQSLMGIFGCSNSRQVGENTKVRGLELIDADPGHDLALLKVAGTNYKTPHLRFSNEEVKKGDEVVLFAQHGQADTIVASPGEILDPDCTEEKIKRALNTTTYFSHFLRELFSKGDLSVLRTLPWFLYSDTKGDYNSDSIESSVLSFPGNSGGALCTTSGDVLGVHTTSTVRGIETYYSKTVFPENLKKRSISKTRARIKLYGFHHPSAPPTQTGGSVPNKFVFPLLDRNKVQYDIA